jgi:hypothetical protein
MFIGFRRRPRRRLDLAALVVVEIFVTLSNRTLRHSSPLSPRRSGRFYHGDPQSRKHFFT